MSAPQGPPAPPPNSGEPQQPYPGQPYPGQPYPGQPSQPAYPSPAYANAPTAKPARITEGPEIGLPPGVAIADLGPRLLGWLIEASVPIVLGVVLAIVASNADGAAPLIIGILVVLLDLGWIAFLGWRYTTEAAGPGTKLMGLQLVGMTDGRPLGWGRWILRYLIFGVVNGVSPVNVVFWILLVLNPRRQGWHDLAVGSIVIKARELAPRPAKPAAAEAAPAPAEAEPTVGIPTSYGTPPPPASYSPGAHYGPVSRSYGGPQSAPSAPTSAPTSTPAAAAPVSAPEPAPVVPAPEPAPAPEPDPIPEPSSAPGPAPVPPAADWTVTVDDRGVTVGRLALFGRNPQRGPGEEDAEIVKVKDEARTVSKTHLALGVDGSELWVEDRGSTNGSAVTSPDGVYRLLGAGERATLQPGWTVSFGQHTITVEQPS